MSNHSSYRKKSSLIIPKGVQKNDLIHQLNIKRTLAWIQIKNNSNQSGPDNTIAAQVILNDFSLDGVGVFSRIALDVDQLVQFKIMEPFQISVEAQVIWCQEYKKHVHIIAKENFFYRIGLKFIFKNPDEQKNLNQAIQKLKEKHIYHLN